MAWHFSLRAAGSWFEWSFKALCIAGCLTFLAFLPRWPPWRPGGGSSKASLKVLVGHLCPEPSKFHDAQVTFLDFLKSGRWSFCHLVPHWLHVNLGCVINLSPQIQLCRQWVQTIYCLLIFEHDQACLAVSLIATVLYCLARWPAGHLAWCWNGLSPWAKMAWAFYLYIQYNI